MVELRELLRDLESVKSKYYSFGVHLNIPTSKLQEWECDHPNNCIRVFQDLLNFVLSNYPEGNCMESTCSALDHIDECLLAQEMRQKYGLLPGLL